MYNVLEINLPRRRLKIIYEWVICIRASPMYNFLMLLFPFKKIMLIFNTHSITNVWIYGHPLHTSVRFSSLDYLSKNKKKEKHMYYRFTSFVKYFLTYTTFKLHRDIKKPYVLFSVTFFLDFLLFQIIYIIYLISDIWVWHRDDLEVQIEEIYIWLCGMRICLLN